MSDPIEDFDLGLALMRRRTEPGVEHTQEDIAAWAGCTRGNIHLIEKSAMKKLRTRLMNDPRLLEAIKSFTRR